jgi:hypothetical protein
MDERVKADYIEMQINALADMKAAEVLWATIADECTKVGDVPAYDELKARDGREAQDVQESGETTDMSAVLDSSRS